jgi:hypothetical protein
MAARLPLHPAGIELGVLIDLPRDDGPGFALLERSAAHAAQLSLRWQPRTGVLAEARDYFPAFDDLFAKIGERFPRRALHHPARTPRAIEAYRRGELLEVTNALVDRYGFGWVTEDAALWPIQGKPDGASSNQEGLRAAARHARVVRAGLEAPLVLDGPSLAESDEETDPFEFFRALADEADVAVSIDAAKIVAHQARRESSDVDSVDELEKLPLARCFEIRLSGTGSELECAEHLAGLCPNVRAIVYDVPAAAASARAERTLSALARLRDTIESRRHLAWDAEGDARVL